MRNYARVDCGAAVIFSGARLAQWIKSHTMRFLPEREAQVRVRPINMDGFNLQEVTFPLSCECDGNVPTDNSVCFETTLLCLLPPSSSFCSSEPHHLALCPDQSIQLLFYVFLLVTVPLFIQRVFAAVMFDTTRKVLTACFIRLHVWIVFQTFFHLYVDNKARPSIQLSNAHPSPPGGLCVVRAETAACFIYRSERGKTSSALLDSLSLVELLFLKSSDMSHG